MKASAYFRSRVDDAAGRLPIHFLFDIDGTLVFPCRGKNWNRDADALCMSAQPKHYTPTLPKWDASPRTALSSSARRLCPLSCDKTFIQQVLLRPHVIPFLLQLLVRRVLDTSRTRVFVSLYTRQSASYCAGIAQQVLLPALAEGSGSSADELTSYFHRLLHNDYCVQLEVPENYKLMPSSPVSAPCRNVSPMVARCDWQKTISVTPSPVTSLLIDDKCSNFRSAEVVTGHTLLVPSFHPRSDDFDVDSCFYSSSRNTEDSFYDAMSQTGNEDDGGCGELMTSTEVEPTSLLELLEGFVRVCYDNHSLLEERQRSLSCQQFHDVGVDSQHQSKLLARIQAHASLVADFNFFEASSQYREMWNSFHAAREMQLHPFFQ